MYRKGALPPFEVAQVFGEFEIPALSMKKLLAFTRLPDPYLAAVAACVGEDGLSGDMPRAPGARGPAKFVPWWQMGRVLKSFLDRGYKDYELARRLKCRPQQVEKALAVYRACPDGRLPEAETLSELLKKAREARRGKEEEEPEKPLFGRLRIRVPSGGPSPDPYLSAVLSAVKGGAAGGEFEPAPEPEGPEWFRSAWQAGRAIFRASEICGLPVAAVGRSLGLSKQYAYELVWLYRTWPDGKPEADAVSSWRSARERWRASRKQAAEKKRSRPHQPPGGGLRRAVEELASIARRTGRPLTAAEIESAAARHKVGVLALMGAWGNRVLVDGPPVSRELAACLDGEKRELERKLSECEARLASVERALSAVRDLVQAAADAFRQPPAC